MYRRRLEPVITVGNKAISRRTAECLGRIGSPEKEASSASREDFILDVLDCNINKDIEEKVVFY